MVMVLIIFRESLMIERKEGFILVYYLFRVFRFERGVVLVIFLLIIRVILE